MEHTAVLSHQLGASVLAVYALQILKSSPWFPWITANTDKVNRVLSMLIAILTSVGIQFTMTGSITAGGSVTAVFPPIWTIVDTLVHTFGQYGVQEGFYRLAVKQ